MAATDLDLLYPALRSDLNAFIEKTFATVSPGIPYIDNWHIQAIAHHLHLCATGKIRRSIISLPPRHLKSIAVSVAFPAWILGHNPSARIICASYGQDLARKLSMDTRRVMNSEWYRETFKATRISPERSTADEFLTTRNGMRLATSVGGPITGFGADYIVIDDPMKPKDANSESARAEVKAWFASSVLTRLNDPKFGVVLAVMQRLHEDDLAGHLLEQGGWTPLRISAIADEDEVYDLGNGVYHRRRGDLLHPQRIGEKELDDIRKSIGSREFSAQYQQSPVPAGGNLLRWEWFIPYRDQPSFEFIIQSWDIATTASTYANYSACTTWGVLGDNCYLLDVVRMQVDFPTLLRRVKQHDAKWLPDLVVVEVTGVGQSLFQQLRHDGMRHVRPVGSKVGKLERVEAVSAVIERGTVLVPASASWLEAFRNEVIAFPNGKNDDQVDSMSQFLLYRQQIKIVAGLHRRHVRAQIPYNIEPTLEVRMRSLSGESRHSQNDIDRALGFDW